MFNIENFSENFFATSSVLSGPVEVLLSAIPAVIILLIGWYFGHLVRKIIQKAFDSIPAVDDAFSKAGFGTLVSRVGWKVNVGKFLGALLETFIIIFAIVMSFELLNFTQPNEFLTNQVLSYIPNVIAATLIVIAGVIIANFAEKVFVGTTKVARVKGGFHAGKVARYSVLVFTGITVLYQLNVAQEIVTSIIVGVIAALSLALGLAFGLGGQQAASDFLRRLEEESKR